MPLTLTDYYKRTIKLLDFSTHSQTKSFFMNVQPYKAFIQDSPNPYEGFYWKLCNTNEYPEWMTVDLPCKCLNQRGRIIPPYTLFFLSGFDFRLNPDLQRKTLNSLRKRKCAVVLIDTEEYCTTETFPFDYILTCTRNGKNSKPKLDITIKDKLGESYSPIKLTYLNTYFRWCERKDKYKDFELLIRECVKQGKTADEIIAYLAQYKNCNLSKPTLARLKRKWGIRSYREEKKPRTPKRKKSDGQSQSPANT